MTQNKKNSKEIKIALAFIVSLTILIVGINFLKGINIFTPTNHYLLKFEKVDGLVISNGVFIKGFKIGQVRNIEYDFTNIKTPFTVDISINDDINIPKGTVANLFDESLMGGKGINIILGEENKFYISGDTLPSDIQVGLLANIGDIVPQVQQTIEHVDSLLLSVNQLVNSEDIDASLKNINTITSNLNTTTHSLDRIVNKQIPNFITNANTLVENLNHVSGDIKEIQFKDLAMQIDTTITNLNEFTTKLNNPNSSIGQLMNNKSLYNNLDSTINSANKLIIDLKQNPKRYVHFSLFGRKDKKED